MSTILIAPGLQNSPPAHWQSWLEGRLENTLRVEQADWLNPYLPSWAGNIRHEITRAKGHVWIIAHSFGCLATAVAAADHSDKIAGVMFVAPADPDKFDVASYLPVERLGFPSVVVASTNDPWMGLAKSAYWADKWGSRLINAGAVGHINVESGFGPWPEGLEIFEQLRSTQSGLPLGSLDPDEIQPGQKHKYTSEKRKRKSVLKQIDSNWHRLVYGIDPLR